MHILFSQHSDVFQYVIRMPKCTISYFRGNTPILINTDLSVYVIDYFNCNNASHYVVFKRYNPISSSVVLRFKIIFESHLKFRIYSYISAAMPLPTIVLR
jgi:hypothetical protein